MARIIHVDDEPEWIGNVRRALIDHQVDSATTYAEALKLIRGSAPYELALIDLNLEGREDRMGGEILDLLMLDFPGTKRVVITAHPPAGDVWSGIYERYKVAGIIIKGRTSIPDLQQVVIRALRGEAGQPSPEPQAGDPDLRERYQAWHAETREEIQRRVRDAESAARHAGRAGGPSVDAAKKVLGEWQRLQRRLASECSRLEEAIASARTSEEMKTVTADLDQVMSSFADEISRTD